MPKRRTLAVALVAVALVTGAPGVAAAAVANGKIAFQSFRDYPGFGGGLADVYTMNPDGAAQTRVTFGVSQLVGTGRPLDPFWSPDGSQIAFVAFRGAGAGNELFVVDADGTNLRQLTFTPQDEAHPSWSPDGSRIAFARFVGDFHADFDIFVMDADGGTAHKITNDDDLPGGSQPDDRNPSWLGTDRIAFESQRGPDDQQRSPDAAWDIYVMNADGSAQTRLTRDADVEVGTAGSRDGTRIAFELAHEIFTMNADGSNVRQLTSDFHQDTSPAWAPDGTKIAFDSTRPGPDGQLRGQQIWTMNADGTGEVQLTASDEGNAQPDWAAASAPLDETAPTVSCGSPDGVWRANNVSIPCTASDTGSGLADPNDASFDLVTSVPPGEEDASAATDSREVCDQAGNCVTAGPVAGNRIDRRAPVISVPEAMTLNATTPAGAVAEFTATASDGADPSPSVVCLPPSGSVFAVGTAIVTCTATDAAGNTATGSFTVTVKGATAQIVELVEKTLALLDAPPLEVTLRQQLVAAVSALVAGNTQTACRGLSLYASAVRLAPRRLISTAQKLSLIEDVERIRAVIACS